MDSTANTLTRKTIPAAVLFCILLQLMDFATTALFLAHGAEEGNPLVRSAFALTSNPLVGLALVKLGAIALLWFAWTSGRLRVVQWANVGYSAIIVWNVTAAAAAAALSA